MSAVLSVSPALLIATALSCTIVARCALWSCYALCSPLRSACSFLPDSLNDEFLPQSELSSIPSERLGCERFCHTISKHFKAADSRNGELLFIDQLSDVMMLDVNVLSLMLTFCIISECDAHLVVTVQCDFWDNVDRHLVDESAYLDSFSCCVTEGNVFRFCCWGRHCLLFLAAPQNDCSVEEETVSHYRFSIFRVTGKVTVSVSD